MAEPSKHCCENCPVASLSAAAGACFASAAGEDKMAVLIGLLEELVRLQRDSQGWTTQLQFGPQS